MTVRWALSIIVGFSAIISDHPVAAGRGAQPSAARRPDILLAVADDWSFPHASVYGDPTVFLYFYRYYFSRKTLRALLARAGFEVLHVESAAGYHAPYNVLGRLVVRGGRTGSVARGALRAIGEPTARRFGLWLNLGDIMFVAARQNDLRHHP